MLEAISPQEITEGGVYAFPNTRGLGSGQLWHIKTVLKSASNVHITARGLTSSVDAFDVTASSPRPYDGKAVYDRGKLTFVPNKPVPKSTNAFPGYYTRAITVSFLQCSEVVRVYTRAEDIETVVSCLRQSEVVTKVGEIVSAPWPFTSKSRPPSLADAVVAPEIATALRCRGPRPGSLVFWPLLDTAYTPDATPRVLCTVAVYGL